MWKAKFETVLIELLYMRNNTQTSPAQIYRYMASYSDNHNYQWVRPHSFIVVHPKSLSVHAALQSNAPHTFFHRSLDTYRLICAGEDNVLSVFPSF